MTIDEKSQRNGQKKSNGNQSSALEYLGQGTLQRPRPRPDNHKAKATDLDFKAKIKD